MYDNIGGKIKKLATVIFAVLAVITIIVGGVIGMNGADFLGMAVMVAGPILAWISSFVLYGFGELVDKTSEIARNIGDNAGKSETQTKIDSERKNELENLRAQGLITEEEYKEAVSKNSAEV